MTRSAGRRRLLCAPFRVPPATLPYVPTPRAVQAGGYRAEVLVNMIGPEGGQAQVKRTLEAIGELFKK